MHWSNFVIYFAFAVQVCFSLHPLLLDFGRCGGSQAAATQEEMSEACLQFPFVMLYGAQSVC